MLHTTTSPAFLIRRFPSADGAYEDDYSEAHSHDHFEFLWVLKGRGTYCLDLLKNEVGDRTVCFAQPGQVHLFTEIESVDGFIISFSESFLRSGETDLDIFYHARHFQVFAGNVVLCIDDELNHSFTEIMEIMIQEQEGEKTFKRELLRRYLKIFLLYLARQVEQNQPSTCRGSQAALVERFISLVNKHFLQQKMVADYARELTVTQNYLNDLVKQFTGYSAGHHIRQRVLMEVKRHAYYTHSSMKEIAYKLGFVDPAHFSKYFKKHTGQNYTDFKRLLYHS